MAASRGLWACVGAVLIAGPLGAGAWAQSSGVVTGAITYREKVALPATAVVRVRLVDVSLPDAPPITMGQQVITQPGQVPVPFAIRYDPVSIDPRRTYSVQADITAGSSVLFTTTTAYRVLTQGHPSDIEVVLEAVSSGALSMVTGTVEMVRPVPVPAGAAVQIQLRDVTAPPIAALPVLSLIGQQIIANPGQLPVPFSIHYRPGLIDPTHRYEIQAVVSLVGSVTLENTTAFPVITQNHPTEVRVLVGGAD
jgi:putative lipoprotein